MIIGAVIVMVEVICRPVTVKTQPVRPRGHEAVFRIVMVSQLVRIQMPFTDVTRMVVASGQYPAETFMVGSHSKLVDYHAGGSGIFAGEQGCTVRRTNRHIGNRVLEAYRVRSQLVDIGCSSFLVAGVAASLIA
ncbi:hypothetical protein ES705_43159 [subsurface metagenome]